MHLAALGVLISTFVLDLCFAGLNVRKHDPDESTLVDASIDILESCYAHRFSDVGLAGPAAGSIMKIMELRNTVTSVTLVDKISMASVHPMDDANRHKLQVFAIPVTNASSLAETLVRMKYSKWWNHMASFILIDQSGTSHGCSNACEILWEAWKMNLLNSKFMCVDPTRGMLIYTFNPYTGKAPVPWQKENTYKGMNGHVWTLFAMQYRKEESHCDQLDYDKTLDLGGYEICAAFPYTTWWWYHLTEKLNIDTRMEKVTAQILKDSLNATWKPFFRPKNFKQHPTIITKNLALEVKNGTCDILFNIVLQIGYEDYKITYPHNEFSLVILTQKRGYKTQVNKIISVLDRPSRFGLIVVLSITLLFFKFYLRKPMIPAILDLVLITCNAGIRKIPEKLAPRIYLGSLFIFLVTIQGIYSGQLATLLTGNVRLQNINSMEDLAQSDHKIYASPFFQVFFNSSAFAGRFVARGDIDCAERASRDLKTACIATRNQALEAAAKFGLHVSSESIGTIRGVYFIRSDWPLEKRANAIYERVVTTGITNFLQIKALESETRTLERTEYEYQHQPIKVITLQQLTFAFVILAIGLGCATIAFIIELAIYEKSRAKHEILMKKWYKNLLKFCVSLMNDLRRH